MPMPLNCPSPLPGQPHLVRKVPALSNFWMRSLRSATKTFPFPSTATSMGVSNCPSPVPPLPHLVKKVPVFENFWMRLLPVSATNTFLAAIHRQARGIVNNPSPLPGRSPTS